MQSGTANTCQWVLESEQLPQGRFIEPLMGWTGTSNPQQQIRLKFDTREQAITYAKRMGYVFRVIEPQKRKFVKKSYSENFQ